MHLEQFTSNCFPATTKRCYTFLKHNYVTAICSHLFRIIDNKIRPTTKMLLKMCRVFSFSLVIKMLNRTWKSAILAIVNVVGHILKKFKFAPPIIRPPQQEKSIPFHVLPFETNCNKHFFWNFYSESRYQIAYTDKIWHFISINLVDSMLNHITFYIMSDTQKQKQKKTKQP